MVAEAPAWVLEELARWMRAFFWAGKKEINGEQCMVAWDTICKPTRFGGLGIKDLRLQGLALRARWCWLRRTDPSRPWQGLPAINDQEANEVFQSLAQFRVGDGESILFWKDRWINGRNAEEIAPEAAALVPTRRKNTRKASDALVEDSWLSDVSGELSVEGWMQCTRLWEELERVPRDGSRPDQILWKGSPSGAIPLEPPITCSAKEEYHGVWLSRFGGLLLPLSVKSLVGWQLDVGFGRRTGGLGMGCRIIRIPAPLACRRRIMWTILWRSVRMPRWSGSAA
jgi:hypothetical protein